ncbi:zincin [Aspergillus steynii IBT 23096]|uniref:Zincin n=1 Tax=Aspergillus steynii IBT 23096 TaxID=1392250 RepID=A0A2I2GPG9_9EURO|nr:zincin [Aspergillus steynii IBT 23096]PLB54774.1 zincin [Aspergillus steynii IBT 23096]
MPSFISLLLLSTVPAIAVPAPILPRASDSQTLPHKSLSPWDAGAVNLYPIHQSCNATQRLQIETGLNETIALADHAKAHILRWGNESAIYRKYFGDSPSIEAIGAYDIVVNGDKGGVLFRCDNPDGNCDLDEWAGHWRGSNATSETVICDLSYTTRRSLTTLCSQGYTVSSSKPNTFWAADLLHRLYHLPAIGQGLIEHYADDYEEVVELAKGDNSTLATKDSNTLQYFALEVFAYDVVVQGEGCSGDDGEEDSHDDGKGEEEKEEKKEDDEEEDIPENCHTHEGGELHCT